MTLKQTISSTMIKEEHLNGVVKIFIDEKELLACGFSGRAKKSKFFYRFKSEEQMKQHIKNFIEEESNKIKAKEEYRKEQKRKTIAFRENVKVGDLFRCSWGWEQTNVNFYQVVSRPSTTKAIIREIEQHISYSNDMCGTTKPRKDVFYGEEITVLLKNECFDLSEHQRAYITTEDKEYCWSSYA